MDANLVAFVASTDLTRSARFYLDTLGLTAEEDSPHALVVNGGGATLRITLVEHRAPAEYTVLGWQVADIAAAMDELRGRGVEFRRYDGLDQDDHDIWTAPSGARVAWFKDPDGNTLSLEQDPS